MVGFIRVTGKFLLSIALHYLLICKLQLHLAQGHPRLYFKSLLCFSSLVGSTGPTGGRHATNHFGQFWVSSGYPTSLTFVKQLRSNIAVAVLLKTRQMKLFVMIPFSTLKRFYEKNLAMFIYQVIQVGHVF